MVKRTADADGIVFESRSARARAESKLTSAIAAPDHRPERVRDSLDEPPPHRAGHESAACVVDDVGDAEPDPPVALLEPAQRGVPGPERPGVVQDADIREARGPVVEVALVSELAVLEPVVAPLEAALAPPAQRRQTARVAAEGQELDTEAPRLD